MTIGLFVLVLVSFAGCLLVIPTANRKRESHVNHVTQEMHLAMLEKVRSDLAVERARADRECDRAGRYRQIAQECILRSEQRQSAHR